METWSLEQTMTPVNQVATSPDTTGLSVRIWIARAAGGLAAAGGFKYGYSFGDQLGGLLLGIAMGLNAALFCLFMANGFTGFLARHASPTSEKSSHAP